MKLSMEFVKRKSVNDKLSKYDYLSNHDSDDFIEVTEWANGEGITVVIKEKTYELTYGQLDAINYLSQVLRYESIKEN